MTENKKCWRGVFAVIGVVLGVMVMATVGFARNPNPGVLPPSSHAFGKTLGEWSAAWQQWALSIPVPDNPTLDETGSKCGVGQSGKVWFLAGAPGFTVTRSCTIPAGKAIFFPIINVECSTLEPPPFHGDTEAELSACAKSFADLMSGLEVDIDGVVLQDLDMYRAQSPLYDFTIPPDNIIGVDTSGSNLSGESVTDGFWILLAPPSVGQHTIHFHGEIPDFDFVLDTTYHITVSPGKP